MILLAASLPSQIAVTTKSDPRKRATTGKGGGGGGAKGKEGGEGAITNPDLSVLIS